MSSRLVRFAAAAIAAFGIVSCGEMHPTGPGSDSPSLRYDAVSSEGGAGPTIATDKPDYAPGDTVTITGAGWQSNESISLVLSEDPAAHEPTQWNVTADADGGFVDRTFIIEQDHIGVAFSLVATGAASADTAQGTFTDGTITAGSMTFYPGGTATGTAATTCSGSAGPPNEVAANTSICVLAEFSIGGSCATIAQFRWRDPNGTIVHISQRDPSYSNGQTGAQAYAASYTPTVAGTWEVLLCESEDTNPAPGGKPGCAGPSARDSATFVVGEISIAAAEKLEITTPDLNGVVGQCYALSVQSQENDGTPINVTTNVQVDLTTEGPGAFYSDNACSTSATSVTISSGSNSASFYYKPTGVGDGAHDITVTDNADELAPDTEAQSVNQAATSLTLVSDNDPSVFGEDVKFTATLSVTAPGDGTPTGNISFYVFPGAQTCSALTGAIALGSAALGSSLSADITVDSLAVGAHDVVACYPGDDDFEDAESNSVEQNVEAVTTSVSLDLEPASQQYSDSVVFTATVTPAEVVTDAGTTALTGLVRFYVATSATACPVTDPGSGGAGSDAIADADNGVATLRYPVSQAAGDYVVTACFYSSSGSFSDSDDEADLEVTAEEVTIYNISYTPDPLISPNLAGSFTFRVREKNPESNDSLYAAGDITLADADVSLKGILFNTTYNLACGAGVAGGTTGYNKYLTFTCVLPANMTADTYEAEIKVNTTGYYAGTTYSVVQVSNPSAGFSTGGGWITIGDDKVNFGFMAKATTNKKNTVIQGSLLVIRHGPNGEVYRAKSNVFNGYTISGTAATFSGKANYSENDTSVGNFDFVGYANDLGTPGAGVDKFGLYLASAGNQVATSATAAGLVASAKVLGGGNVQVPQPGRK